jgi:hypothetical protein
MCSDEDSLPQSQEALQGEKLELGMVVYPYNPIYLRGGGRIKVQSWPRESERPGVSIPLPSWKTVLSPHFYTVILDSFPNKLVTFATKKKKKRKEKKRKSETLSEKQVKSKKN